MITAASDGAQGVYVDVHRVAIFSYASAWRLPHFAVDGLAASEYQLDPVGQGADYRVLRER